MLKELYTAALGMLPQQTRLEVISNNMANANTAGFKRESVFETTIIDARANFYEVPGDAEQDDPPTGSYIDFTEGSYQQTNNPLDLSIGGNDRFFVLLDDVGNEYLTRTGRFQISADGTVEAMDGCKLMGANGPLNLFSEFGLDNTLSRSGNSVDLRIETNGEVFANDRFVGNIQQMKVENLNSLQKLSATRFVATKDTYLDIVPYEEIDIRQGWLENSNVNIVSEMVQMIELQRMFEAGSKVIQTNNETLDRSIAIGRYF